MGSNPTGDSNTTVVQLEEHLNTNQAVGGSNPSSRSINFMVAVATRGMNKSNTSPAKPKLVKVPLTVKLGNGSITKTVVLEPGGEPVVLTALPMFPPSPFNAVPDDVRNGLTMVYDLEELIEQQAAEARSRPLDIEHNTEGRGSDTRSRGWWSVVSADHREPGLGMVPDVPYAWVDLNSLGREAIDGKHYGYTSAVAFGHYVDDKTIRFTGFKSLALTNNPGASGMQFLYSVEDGTSQDYLDAGYTSQAASEAASTEEERQQMQILEQLIKALGLAADTTAEAAIAAVTALTTAEAASKAAVTTLTAKTDADTVSLTAAQGQVTELTAQVADLTAKLTAKDEADAEREVVAAVDAAIKAGKATPAQREAQLGLARANLADYLANTALALSVVGAGAIAKPGEVADLTDEEKAFCEQFGFKETSYIRAKQ